MLLQILFHFLLLTSAVIAQDICHSDPRVQVLTRSCHPPENALHIPRLGSNPFHALHDIIWAFSHYMVHCAPNHLTLYLNEYPVNIDACSSFPSNQTMMRNPHWGTCVVYFMAKYWNVKLILRPTSWPKGWPPDPPELCYARNVFLGALRAPVQSIRVRQWHFRNLNWFSSVCSSEEDCSYMPLSTHLKDQALRHIRQVIHHKFPPKRSDSRSINVLLYDRSDTRRRQWSNAELVHSLLRKDARVRTRLIHHVPSSFHEQVRLFTWPDIIIAPHGAAMANTIFMREGSEVIEIWKYCRMDVQADPQKARDWTGWHSRQIGVGLTYVQCHVKDHGIRPRSELFTGKTGGLTEGKQIVRIAEILGVFNEAVNRVQMRKTVKQRLITSSVPGYRCLLASSYVIIMLFAVCSLCKLGTPASQSISGKGRKR